MLKRELVEHFMCLTPRIELVVDGRKKAVYRNISNHQSQIKLTETENELVVTTTTDLVDDRQKKPAAGALPVEMTYTIDDTKLMISVKVNDTFQESRDGKLTYYFPVVCSSEDKVEIEENTLLVRLADSSLKINSNQTIKQPIGLDERVYNFVPGLQAYPIEVDCTGLNGDELVLTISVEPGTADNASVQADEFDLVRIERERILPKAEKYLQETPRTVTADQCERSKGGKHDFYSEGDYWWPDPKKPDGPYTWRDGQTNPGNFVAHRESMVRLSDIVATQASAWLITQDEKYAASAVAHLKAWFVDEATRMNPSLLYGQAIKGRHTGRSIGVIDTIHLVEVAMSAKKLCESSAFQKSDQTKVKTWFRQYLTWLNTHAYGKKEKQHPNNHGVCWSLQAAAFAQLVDDEEQLKWIRKQFKEVYLKKMMNKEGGFPAELKRTKPYGYSLFVIDAMAGVAQLASSDDDDLWTFELSDGRGMQQGVKFIAPFIIDKKSWPKKPDVMYWDNWPVRHPSLLLGGIKFRNAEYLATWEKLDADPTVFEVLRNLPMRHPLLWR